MLAGEPWEEDRIGMNVLRHYQGWKQGAPMVLISDWWMREHWGRGFEILDITHGAHGQNWPLLRKRDVELSAQQIDGPARTRVNGVHCVTTWRRYSGS